MVKDTFDYYYYGLSFDWYRSWGFVAENLVKLHYGIEPEYKNEPDEGYDFVDGDRKIDIKSKVVPYEYHHYYDSTYYCVKCYKPLTADFYLFAKIDPVNKVCSIVSWCNHDELTWYGELVKKGEKHHTRPDPVANDAYFIGQKFTHLV